MFFFPYSTYAILYVFINTYVYNLLLLTSNRIDQKLFKVIKYHTLLPPPLSNQLIEKYATQYGFKFQLLISTTIAQEQKKKKYRIRKSVLNS